jgi:cytochrome c oxidase subunit 2
VGIGTVGTLASPLDPRSPQARAIADLFSETLVVCGVIFAIVTILIGYAVVRFRDRGGGAPPQIEGNTRLEMAWTAAPLGICVGLFALTYQAVQSSDPTADREPDLTVIAHQWWWEVHYRSGATTANEIHIPVGKPLAVAIESKDVVHDFWVPDLARKIDAVPGRTSTIWMQADAPGNYVGACAEYCGAQHAWMRILVVAQPPEEFLAWERNALTPAPSPDGEAATRGARDFATMTCVKCHDIAGNGERARAGPDLTHIAERATLGAGVMKNSPAELARWLRDPQAIKEGSHMPNVQLTDAQVADFVAYFETLQ